MRIELRRFAYTPMGTFGRLFIPDRKWSCWTVERPWVPDPNRGPAGKPYESCVPEALYICEPYASRKHKLTWALVNDELGVSITRGSRTHRWGILIHVASLAEQLHGCIAPGKALGVLNLQWGVVSSRSAFDELIKMTTVGGGLPELHIRFDRDAALSVMRDKETS